MTSSLADWYARFPEGWWGYHWEPPNPMSAVELIGTPTIDSRLMATLWAVVNRRRSVMLSSEAPQAGKTTLLSALVDFLPDDTTGIFVRGWWEEYEWLDEVEPGTGYLLINEMSDHLPIYVWGRAARGALILAGREIQPSGVPAMIQGVILFCLIVADVFVRYRVRIVRSSAAVAATASEG